MTTAWTARPHVVFWPAPCPCFAVGCPVCNKVVLLALGSSGALTWFAPVQPLLAVLSIAGLAWALRVRLTNQRACRAQPARSAIPRP